MSLIRHPATGLPVGDPDLRPLAAGSMPSLEEAVAAFESMIVSASGWRKVFAADGDGDSLDASVSLPDLYLVSCAGMAFAAFLRARSGKPAPAVILGIDSRPTGPALADALARVFLAEGLELRYDYIVAAPEIMAQARAGGPEPASGFCYVSASHNPPGHNGLKFGLDSGGVLPGPESRALAASFEAIVRDPGSAARLAALLKGLTPSVIAAAFASCPAWKRRAVSDYTLFMREVVTGLSDLDEQEAFLEAAASGARERGLGVIAELNGSARSLSIDSDFLEGFSLHVKRLNDTPGRFAHRIVPEGESLDQCARALEAAHAHDEAFLLGYVPDCDGDRGNLVYFDEGAGRAVAMAAQEVFALCCVAELAQLFRQDILPGARAAVVVNDATSMRIDRIAAAFGATVARAETGEANVVGRAAELRAAGYVVRILGEGSNGGNITHPEAVRDPLATLAAIVKLLAIQGLDGREGLFDAWLRLSGQPPAASGFGVADLVRSLPAFATTSVFEPRAAIRVRERDQSALKARYQPAFERSWRERAPELSARYGIVSYEAAATLGAIETRGLRSFAEAGKGGLRLILKDCEGREIAFLWMRGSGTEPVLRIMADIEGGGAEDEAYLLSWQRALVVEADAG